MRTIIIYGGSLNPPGVHHEKIARALSAYKGPEDLVFVVPCGERPDKLTTNYTASIHRACLIRKVFEHIPGIALDLDDLEKNPGEPFTRSIDLIDRYKQRFPNDKIVLVVGQDLIRYGRDLNSDIHHWYKGEFLWNTASFLILTRGQDPIDPRDLPPNCEVLHLNIQGSSEEIRTKIANAQAYDTLVNQDVYKYILRYQLYTGRIPPNPTLFKSTNNAIVVFNPHQKRTNTLLRMVRRVYKDRKHLPVDHIIVIGGDGFMIDAIHSHIHLGLPIIGLNAGTVGFLLNGGTIKEIEMRLQRGEFLVYQQSMLTATEGIDHSDIRTAFNEIFLRSANNQASHMRVTIDGVVRFENLVGDGLMISTPGGSTGWARSYGAQPLIIGTPMLVLTGVGTTVCGNRWISAPLNRHSIVTIEVLDREKRPMEIQYDGVTVGTSTRVTIRSSNTQAVELCFFPETDLAEKLSRSYFPF